MYLNRKIDIELTLWGNKPQRKPLLLRGARQVGKSSSVREYAKNFKYFIEVNFEEHKEVHNIFKLNLSPHEICNNLSAYYNVPVIPGESLIFFDEIQSCIPAISSLRFFYEKYSELHLIAAGSLLEFALSEIPSFGVGRIRTMFVYPFSFEEFLMAKGEKILLNAKKNASEEHPLPEPIHNKLNNLLKQFLILGGMPEVIASYIKNSDLIKCISILDDLLLTYESDFAKYKNLVPSSRILEVFNSVAEQVGNKFIYTKASAESKIRNVKDALDLLIMAGLVIPVTHTAANGIPLGAELDFKKRKMLLFDTGLFLRLLGLDIKQILFGDDFNLINKGHITELFAGLELLKAYPGYSRKDLYYWKRENKSSNAEVDYLVQKNDKIVPIEVKSSKQGSMKSIYILIEEKNINIGVRFSLENYSSYKKIKVFPLYAIPEFIERDL